MEFLLLPLLTISISDYSLSIINKILILVVTFIGLVFTRKGSKEFSFLLILIVLLFSIGILTIQKFAFTMAIDFLFFLTFFFLVFNKLNFNGNSLNINLTKIYKFLYFSFLISVIYVMFLIFSGENMFEYDYGSYRFIGSNGTAGSAIYYLTLYIPFFINYRYKNSKSSLIISLILASLILWTGSRMAILVLLSITFLDLYLQTIKKFLKLTYIVIFLSIIIYMILLLGERMFFGNEISVSNLNLSGRNILWEFVVEHSFDSVYFGHGHGATTNLLLESKLMGGTRDYQVHNDYLKVYYNFGLFGLMIFFIFLFSIFKKIHHYKDYSHEHLILFRINTSYLIGFLMFMLTDNILIYYFYFYPFLIFFFLMIYGRNKEIYNAKK